MCDDRPMRTTVSIDDDVLAAARMISAEHKTSIGEVLSALARKGLRPPSEAPAFRNGIMLLPKSKNARSVTLDIVNKLREELGD